MVVLPNPRYVIKVIRPELETDGNRLNLPCEVAETSSAYSKECLRQPLHAHAQTFCGFSVIWFPTNNVCLWLRNKAIRRLRPQNSVGIDGISALIINGCSDILTHVLNFIFHLRLSQRIFFFPSGNKGPLFPILKKRKTALVNNYRLISILNTFPQNIINYPTWARFISFEVQIYTPRYHGFIKYESTTTNFAYLDSVNHLVHFQRQVDIINFVFSNSFDLVPHTHCFS
jgi:hypothetical protein